MSSFKLKVDVIRTNGRYTYFVVIALSDFKGMLESFDVGKLANSLGVPVDVLEGLGLREFSSLLNSKFERCISFCFIFVAS